MIDDPTTDTQADPQADPLADVAPSTVDWRLEGEAGALAPRSALDVLTNLNERVAADESVPIVPALC
jgi:hypothetical protein